MSRAAPIADPALTDTAPPGAWARATWTAPHLATHAFAGLSATELVLSPRPAAGPARLAEAFLAGAGGDDLARLGARVVPLASVNRATLHLHLDAVGLDVAGSPPLTLGWADAAGADAFFSRLLKRLGPDARVVTDRPSRLEVARAPLGVMAAILVATAIFAATLAELPVTVAELSDPPAWLSALACLDWRLASLAGGVCLTAAQLWLMRRLNKPPGTLTVYRLPDPATRRIGAS